MAKFIVEGGGNPDGPTSISELTLRPLTKVEAPVTSRVLDKVVASSTPMAKFIVEGGGNPDGPTSISELTLRPLTKVEAPVTSRVLDKVVEGRRVLVPPPGGIAPWVSAFMLLPTPPPLPASGAGGTPATGAVVPPLPSTQLLLS